MSAAASTPHVVARPRRSSGRLAGRILSTAVLLFAAMALIAVVVAGANGIRIRVEQTGSMAPALNPGDLVLVAQTPIDAIRTGDVIGVQAASGAVIVHRVERLESFGGSLRVTTKGDANPTSESWTISRGESVALVRGSVPSVGAVVDALQGPWIAVIVLLAGLLLAGGLLRSIWSRPA